MKPDSREADSAREALGRLECQLEARYCQVGKSVLELADSELKDIGSLVDEIVRLRLCLARAEGERPCPACMAYNTADSRFCKRCGQALESPDHREESSHDRQE